MDDLSAALIDWYDVHARPLPWRETGTSPWAVLVSEVMLQQTPVARVLPVWSAWMDRWPAASDLASSSPAQVLRQWGKLGYPRRALRLWECARVVAGEYAGQVPDDVDALLRLPGIGAYTARAVASFAFGQRHPVVDTNVRRVVARAVLGRGEAGPPSTARDLADVATLLPTDHAARFSVAIMELGAVVCTASSPSCSRCPLRDRCAWRRAGAPPYTGPTARPQRFAGTDRQVRGLLLDVLRGADEPVDPAALDIGWPDPAQRLRALDSLVTDGLVESLPDGRFALPLGEAH